MEKLNERAVNYAAEKANELLAKAMFTFWEDLVILYRRQHI